MKLSNQKTFENWCEKNGFRADAMLDDAERWASECDGTYGNADIIYETGRTTQYGSPETIAFDLVKPAIYKIVDENGGTIEEAVYRFRG